MFVRVRLALAGLLLSLVWSLAGQAATTSDSGVFVEVKSSAASGASTERYKLYGSSHALVIGIDNYSNGWPRLSNAVKDARLVAAELRRRGFEVQILTDVTGVELRTSLREFFGIKGADPEARLFVWFAGHGHTQYGEGYLVPADAPDPADPRFIVTALHMGDVASMARIARSKHVFSVFDSCFAGTVFSASRSKPPPAVTQAAVQPVRQFLTSGDADQQVSDDGTFRRLFLGALRGRENADLNGDGYLTGTELGFYLEDRVVNLTQASQTPRSGKLRDPRFDRGDFIFLLPDADIDITVTAPATSSVDQSTFDLTFWQSIQGSDNPEDYEAYLDTFPAGQFAALAKVRLRSLEPEAAAKKASPQTQQGMNEGASHSAALPSPIDQPDRAAFDGIWEGRSGLWRVEITIHNGTADVLLYCRRYLFGAEGLVLGADGMITGFLKPQFRGAGVKSIPIRGKIEEIIISEGQSFRRGMPTSWPSCREATLSLSRQ